MYTLIKYVYKYEYIYICVNKYAHLTKANWG